MCGIGGILRTDGEPIPEEWLDAIDARIAYRGPDGSGRFRDRVEFTDDDGERRVVEVAFVHRRLSIIDHDDGAQPMVSERGRNDDEGLVAVVFNGCIYNHRELREELEAKGHEFVTDHSDTEVLIHGWRQWGRKLTDHLEGMYAFAVWDRAKALLTLARDWFGEKPLYTAQSPDWGDPSVVGFSSEPAAFLSLETNLRSEFRIADGLDVGDFLRQGYSYSNDTPTWHIGDESAGVSFSQGSDNHANFAREKALRLTRWRPVKIGVVELLEQAVKQRLEADVPIGCFLSGGVDSSLVAHFARLHKPDLRTFSVRMPDPRYDETVHAERASAHLGVEHVTLDCDARPAEDLVCLINRLGQPFGDSSILPTYWVSKAAREHVKVALSGDGGDELFVGYERYLAAPTLARHHRILRALPARWLTRFHPKTRLHKLGRLGDMARDYPTLGLAAMESLFTLDQIGELTDGQYQPLDRCDAEDDATASLRLDDLTHGYLAGDLLRKTDTASMAVALEVRCPFLDRDLARAVLNMPIDQLIPGGQRKGLLRNIARKYLPAAIVNRPKMGFAIPIGEWFRSDFGGMKSLLLDHLESTDPFGPIELNQKAVRRFIDEHMSGKRDHSHRLFTLLTLSIWAKSTVQGRLAGDTPA